MQQFSNVIDIQRQNELRRIADAQNRLAMLDQQAQLQAQQNYGQNLQAQFPPTQTVQAQTVAGLNGKIVPAVENIVANDVPMDGSVAFFPKQDMTEIYAKAWNADGTIRTVVYKPIEPILDTQANNSTLNAENVKIALSDEATEAFMKRFDDIAERLEKMEKSFGKPANGRVRKEVIADE